MNPKKGQWLPQMLLLSNKLQTWKYTLKQITPSGKFIKKQHNYKNTGQKNTVFSINILKVLLVYITNTWP